MLLAFEANCCHCCSLQVPRGTTMPGSLETFTYQAQVLGKGSIKPELVQQQQQQASTPFASDPANAAGTTGGGSAVRSPFRDALSKISRIGLSRAGSDRGAASGGSPLQSQASDTLPRMQFLQKAAKSMRTEQQRQGLRMPSATKQPAGAAAATGLHTVVEVQGRSEGGAAEGAAAAAVRGSVAAPAGLGANVAAGQQQQMASGERPSSCDLRATDMVLGNASLRRRMLGAQQGGDEEGAESDSPRAPGEGAAGFVARSAWPMSGTGQLAHSGLKRRSQNYS